MRLLVDGCRLGKVSWNRHFSALQRLPITPFTPLQELLACLACLDIAEKVHALVTRGEALCVDLPSVLCIQRLGESAPASFCVGLFSHALQMPMQLACLLDLPAA
jgi:hypothetical protein